MTLPDDSMYLHVAKFPRGIFSMIPAEKNCSWGTAAIDDDKMLCPVRHANDILRLTATVILRCAFDMPEEVCDNQPKFDDEWDANRKKWKGKRVGNESNALRRELRANQTRNAKWVCSIIQNADRYALPLNTNRDAIKSERRKRQRTPKTRKSDTISVPSASRSQKTPIAMQEKRLEQPDMWCKNPNSFPMQNPQNTDRRYAISEKRYSGPWWTLYHIAQAGSQADVQHKLIALSDWAV